MKQQINLYQSAIRPEKRLFSGRTLVQSALAVVSALLLTYGFSSYRVNGLSSEMELLHQQESSATQRAERLVSVIAKLNGGEDLSRQLEIRTLALHELETLLDLLRELGLGDTTGFSRYLLSLARQQFNGLWLTRITLSASGKHTVLEGRALDAESVPLYLQNLSEEPPFVGKGFTQFAIERPEDLGSGVVTFSMHSNPLLGAGRAAVR